MTPVSPLNLYAIVRRRWEEKKFKARGMITFVRTLTYVMPRSEYNINYPKLGRRKEYLLENSRVLVHYYYSGAQEDFCIPRAHGNSMKNEDFVQRKHTFMIQCKEEINSIPRIVVDNFDKETDVFVRDEETSIPRKRNKFRIIKLQINA